MLRISSILIGILVALGFSQFPEYAQQYEQRLGGAVDELTTIVVDFDASAERANLSREDALIEYETSGGSFLADRGSDMRKTISRQERLSSHLTALQESGIVTRFVSMGQYFDSEISSRALQNYSPAVPTSMDSLIFLAAGFLFGALFTSLFWSGCRRLVRRGKAPTDAAATGRTR